MSTSPVSSRSAPSLRLSHRPRPTPLPAPLTPLVGREHEAALAGSLLCRADVRLLTITGPGGIGKTRLAIKVAGDLADAPSLGSGQAFADGVRFVSLASVPDPERVLDTIFHALGNGEIGGRSLRDALVATLGEADLPSTPPTPWRTARLPPPSSRWSPRWSTRAW